MKNCNLADHRLSHDATLLNDSCQRTAGRAGVVAAIPVFIAVYVYGISKFGIVLGIALGWLPGGLVAWLTVVVVAKMGAPVIHHVTVIWRRWFADERTGRSI